MPVNMLLCEGVPTSSDVRVLTCLFRGHCQVNAIKPVPLCRGIKPQFQTCGETNTPQVVVNYTKN
jgi:hypothetical protein